LFVHGLQHTKQSGGGIKTVLLWRKTHSRPLVASQVPLVLCPVPYEQIGQCLFSHGTHSSLVIWQNYNIDFFYHTIQINFPNALEEAIQEATAMEGNCITDQMM
jgi:hypothetical protein